MLWALLRVYQRNTHKAWLTRGLREIGLTLFPFRVSTKVVAPHSTSQPAVPSSALWHCFSQATLLGAHLLSGIPLLASERSLVSLAPLDSRWWTNSKSPSLVAPKVGFYPHGSAVKGSTICDKCPWFWQIGPSFPFFCWCYMSSFPILGTKGEKFLTLCPWENHGCPDPWYLCLQLMLHVLNVFPTVGNFISSVAELGGFPQVSGALPN